MADYNKFKIIIEVDGEDHQLKIKGAVVTKEKGLSEILFALESAQKAVLEYERRRKNR